MADEADNTEDAPVHGMRFDKIALPAGLSQETFDRAVGAIVKWEDEGDMAADLALELYGMFAAKAESIHLTDAGYQAMGDHLAGAFAEMAVQAGDDRSMTPLERAARAKLSPLHRAAGAISDEMLDGWAEPGSEGWDKCLAAARAALTAIREPSEGVEIAVAQAIQDRLPCDSGNDPPDVSVMVEYGVSKAAIAAMINAALAQDG